MSYTKKNNQPSFKSTAVKRLSDDDNWESIPIGLPDEKSTRSSKEIERKVPITRSLSPGMFEMKSKSSRNHKPSPSALSPIKKQSARSPGSVCSRIPVTPSTKTETQTPSSPMRSTNKSSFWQTRSSSGMYEQSVDEVRAPSGTCINFESKLMTEECTDPKKESHANCKKECIFNKGPRYSCASQTSKCQVENPECHEKSTKFSQKAFSLLPRLHYTKDKFHDLATAAAADVEHAGRIRRPAIHIPAEELGQHTWTIITSTENEDDHLEKSLKKQWKNPIKSTLSRLRRSIRSLSRNRPRKADPYPDVDANPTFCPSLAKQAANETTVLDPPGAHPETSQQSLGRARKSRRERNSTSYIGKVKAALPSSSSTSTLEVITSRQKGRVSRSSKSASRDKFLCSKGQQVSIRSPEKPVNNANPGSLTVFRYLHELRDANLNLFHPSHPEITPFYNQIGLESKSNSSLWITERRSSKMESQSMQTSGLCRRVSPNWTAARIPSTPQKPFNTKSHRKSEHSLQKPKNLSAPVMANEPQRRGSFNMLLDTYLQKSKKLNPTLHTEENHLTQDAEKTEDVAARKIKETKSFWEKKEMSFSEARKHSRASLPVSKLRLATVKAERASVSENPSKLSAAQVLERMLQQRQKAASKSSSGSSSEQRISRDRSGAAPPSCTTFSVPSSSRKDESTASQSFSVGKGLSKTNSSSSEEVKHIMTADNCMSEAPSSHAALCASQDSTMSAVSEISTQISSQGSLPQKDLSGGDAIQKADSEGSTKSLKPKPRIIHIRKIKSNKESGDDKITKIRRVISKVPRAKSDSAVAMKSSSKCPRAVKFREELSHMTKAEMKTKLETAEGQLLHLEHRFKNSLKECVELRKDMTDSGVEHTAIAFTHLPIVVDLLDLGDYLLDSLLSGGEAEGEGRWLNQGMMTRAMIQVLDTICFILQQAAVRPMLIFIHWLQRIFEALKDSKVAATLKQWKAKILDSAYAFMSKGTSGWRDFKCTSIEVAQNLGKASSEISKKLYQAGLLPPDQTAPTPQTASERMNSFKQDMMKMLKPVIHQFDDEHIPNQDELYPESLETVQSTLTKLHYLTEDSYKPTNVEVPVAEPTAKPSSTSAVCSTKSSKTTSLVAKKSCNNSFHTFSKAKGIRVESTG